jgi:hypothetical protein
MYQSDQINLVSSLSTIVLKVDLCSAGDSLSLALAGPFILMTSVDLCLCKGYQVTVFSLAVSLAEFIDLSLSECCVCV